MPRKEVKKMSVRAYRVKEIDYVTPNSFNLWHDDELVKFFDEGYGLFESLTEGAGLTYLPVEALEKAIAELELEDCTVEALKKDIEAGKANDGWIQYYCF